MDQNTLESLRNWMQNKNIDAFIIPSSDPHQSEYVAEYWQVRSWLTGFTGSAGTAVVTKNDAQVWTDSRYTIQAAQELETSNFRLMTDSSSDRSSYRGWLKQHLPQGAVVGIDGQLISQSQLTTLEKQLAENDILVELVDDPFVELWSQRPELPSEVAIVLPKSLGLKSREDKIGLIRNHLLSSEADFIVITDLDEICYLLNLRSRDITYNTSLIGYLIVGLNVAVLFVHDGKLSPETKSSLKGAGIDIQQYHELNAYIDRLPAEARMIVDPVQCNALLFNRILEHEAIEQDSIVMLTKAIKSAAEIKNIEEVVIQDGVALTQAFIWLDKNISQNRISESDFAQQIAFCRGKQEGYFSESFGSIVGFNENGAIVHYRPVENNSKIIHGEGILLVDSGGHYMNGTTDLTRTIAIGSPTSEQMKHFTCVLKGHIALARAIFPKGTTGHQLDAFARSALWQHGLNYGHGTGHGVGYFSNVHEPPYGISPISSRRRNRPLKPGVLITNEPGYYLEGAYGIRIENMMLVATDDQYPDEQYHRFNTLSLFPIDQNLIDQTMLTRGEIKWIDAYHDKVRTALIPRLESDFEKFWMLNKTRPLPRVKIAD